ncbi:hypothetical protein [Ekhidna sp.]
MMRKTNEYLDANTSVWTAIPISSSYKADLASLLDLIRTSADSKEVSQMFVSPSVTKLKNQVAERMDILDDVLEAYAEDTGNKALLEAASNSKADYLRLPGEEFENMTRNIIDLLEENVDNMSDYGMTKDQIEDAKLLFCAYQDEKGRPRFYEIAARSDAKDLNDFLFKGKNVMTRLDNVMKRFRKSNTDFYLGYLSARTIQDPSSVAI